MKLVHVIRLVDGQRITLLRGGQGPRVLLLHGWGSAAERYREALQLIPEDAATFVIPDLPGFGGSEKPSTVWGINEYAQWVKKLLTNLEWSPCILMGHSFGGSIAISFAAQYPKEVTTLILYAAGHLTPRHTVKIRVFRTIARVSAPIFSLPWFQPALTRVRRALYRLIGSEDYVRAGAMKEIFQRVIEERVTHLLPYIQTPTVVLWGRNDTETPPQDAETIVSQVPHVTRIMLEGVGHAMHRERPDLFAKELQQILGHLSRP